MRSYYKNAHPETVIVQVDQDGTGPDGETFAGRANPQHVVGDLVWELPVVLSKPDGTLAMGTRIVVTSAGAAAGILA